MLHHNTSLADLLISAEPAQSVGSPKRAAGSPKPLPATDAAADPSAPVLDQTTIAEAIAGTMGEVDLAAFLGVSPSRIRTLARDQVLVVAVRGRRGSPTLYDVRASLLGYLARLRDGATGRGGGPVTDEMKAEKLRLAKQQADKIEIQNNAARGELVRAADVEREWANVLRDIRSTMLAVSSRAGAKLPHLTAHDIAEIDREIKTALEGLANGN